MRCPYCANPDTKVLETRSSDEGRAIKRRRECIECGRRITTYEKVEETQLVVVKKDGQWQSFDRAKLMAGLLKACEKRSVPLEKLEGIISEVERELRTRYEREVPSKMIGELVMERLLNVDEVAYVRFASVYRQFKDLNRFLAELEDLLEAQRDKA